MCCCGLWFVFLRVLFWDPYASLLLPTRLALNIESLQRLDGVTGVGGWGQHFLGREETLEVKLSFCKHSKEGHMGTFEKVVIHSQEGCDPQSPPSLTFVWNFRLQSWEETNVWFVRLFLAFCYGSMSGLIQATKLAIFTPCSSMEKVWHPFQLRSNTNWINGSLVKSTFCSCKGLGGLLLL